MNAIIFDLELVKRFKKGQLSEIVEIGACKVDMQHLKIVDQFQIYLNPAQGYISKSTRKFIHMTKEDTKNAVSFSVGLKQFIDWLGEDYYLCAWGKDDKAHFVNQCVRLKLDLDWLKNYNDIQNPIGKILTDSSKNQIGLKTALEIAGIEPVGQSHRGIDDAINTAQLFLKYATQIALQKNEVSKKEKVKQYQSYLKARLHNRKARADEKKKSPAGDQLHET